MSRNRIILSKIVQNVSSGVAFGEKVVYLVGDDDDGTGRLYDGG